MPSLMSTTIAVPGSHCVHLRDYGETHGHCILVFEVSQHSHSQHYLGLPVSGYCVQALGPSLADEMEKRKFVPFPMTRIQSFGKDMCSAVR